MKSSAEAVPLRPQENYADWEAEYATLLVVEGRTSDGKRSAISTLGDSPRLGVVLKVTMLLLVLAVSMLGVSKLLSVDSVHSSLVDVAGHAGRSKDSKHSKDSKDRKDEEDGNDRPRPHVLFLLADDFGWANFGPHTNENTPEAARRKREVQTPFLDSLVRQGILLERHYAYKVCGPSRASLQSGRLPVHVGISNHGSLLYNASDPMSGFSGIPRYMTGFAEKMQSRGYVTRAIGKWDAGLATPEHTPGGRGYEEFYGYYLHANDYWTAGTPLIAVGEIDNCLGDFFLDLSEKNATYSGGVSKEDLRYDCSNSTDPDPECYEEHLFKRKGLQMLDAFDPDLNIPLLMFYSFHLLHTPLQVPLSYLQRIDELTAPFHIEEGTRRLYAAMVLYMDDVVKELVDKLKMKGMYDNTLIVFASDNGGPVYDEGGSNNWPLRGGKYSDFEGGYRVNAFVSGGYIPKRRRGTVYDGVVSIADWYGIMCELAGADPTDYKAMAANAKYGHLGIPLLPPVDSLPGLWGKIITGNTDTGRKFLQLSPTVLLMYPWKLVTGLVYYGRWQGELFPNCTEPNTMRVYDSYIFDRFISVPESVLAPVHCGQGCLFNVEVDPAETLDLATSNSQEIQEIFNEMVAKLAVLNQDLFQPLRGESAKLACDVWIAKRSKFYGPFVDVEDFYSTPQYTVPESEWARGQQWVDVVNVPANQEAIFHKGNPFLVYSAVVDKPFCEENYTQTPPKVDASQQFLYGWALQAGICLDDSSCAKLDPTKPHCTPAGECVDTLA